MSFEPVFIRKPKLKPVKFYVNPEVYEKFTEAVKNNDLAISEVMIQLIAWFAETHVKGNLRIREK